MCSGVAEGVEACSCKVRGAVSMETSIGDIKNCNIAADFKRVNTATGRGRMGGTESLESTLKKNPKYSFVHLVIN